MSKAMKVTLMGCTCLLWLVGTTLSNQHIGLLGFSCGAIVVGTLMEVHEDYIEAENSRMNNLLINQYVEKIKGEK